ncbi:MAG TPA: alpha-galactosidase [Bacteroidales bacterium]|nr:alpha-galactosidase [Bacteroidales bacterium]
MKRSIILIFLFATAMLYAQNPKSEGKSNLVAGNNYIRRTISLEGGSIVSTGLFIAGSDENFISRGREFSFTLNGKHVDGGSGWKLVRSEDIHDSMQGSGIKITLQSQEDPLGLELNYLFYPGLPVVRKWIIFHNTGKEDIRVEDLNIEDLETRIGYIHSIVLHNYARMKNIGVFEGTWDDPVVVLHDTDRRRGIAIGNESPGVLKRTSYHTRGNNIEAGLTHSNQGIAFRKWLRPGETWESPKTFLCLYSGTDNGEDVLNGDVNRFVVRHMETRIITSADKPVFVYNTWNPFRTFVSDTLVRDVAKAAAECGIQEFIIDDGWQINDSGMTSEKAWGNNYGDWNVDQKKFPGGLKPTFDYIRSLGMKPGLWISIGSATPDAGVYQAHPEWFVKDKEGKPGNLHERGNPNFITSCLGTDWTEYIKKEILTLVNEYGLGYAKLDFSIITSAYVNDDSISGCYATDHPYHKDHRESYIVIYERLMKLFDELHHEAPDLFIDCTFETAGKLQLMDYAIAQHAEGNWLSNVEEPYPTGALRVRHLAWWRSPALPASSLVIGNLQMNEENFEFGLKSLIGSLPIVLGDPRKLTPEKRARIKQWSDWMQEMQKKHDYMSFRTDLPGFGEPAEGMWDGWMRFNDKTQSGGIAGVFRQNAPGTQRTVVLRDLDPQKLYSVKLAPEGKEILKATGKILMEKGFIVSIEDEIDGKIYEITTE